MKRFVEGADRGQSTLFPEPVRIIDVFVHGVDLGALDFGGVDPKATGRPSYHQSILSNADHPESGVFVACVFTAQPAALGGAGAQRALCAASDYRPAA